MRHLLSQGFSLLAEVVYPWERSLPAEPETARTSAAQAPQAAAASEPEEYLNTAASGATAAPPPPPPKPQTTSSRVLTTFGYGILATNTSWLIGVRRLVRYEHARLLALKTAGPHLPQELVDLISDALFALDAPILQKKIDAKSEGFCWDPPKARKGLPAEREVQRRIDATGIIINGMQRNDAIHLSLDPYTSGLVLLRSATKRIRIGIVPVTRPSRIFPSFNHQMNLERESDHFRYGAEAIASFCSPPADEKGPDYHSFDLACYNRPVDFPDLRGETWGLARYLHLGCLEEVIRGRDGAAAESVVEMLGLEIVPASRWVREEDKMKPTLVSFQRHGADQEDYDFWETIKRG